MSLSDLFLILGSIFLAPEVGRGYRIGFGLTAMAVSLIARYYGVA